MTYYSHSPSFKHPSPLMRQRSLRTLHDPQSTMDSLIVFYRDEQYWIRRARTAMTLDRDSTMTGSSDSSSSRSDHARSSKHTSQRSLQHLSSPPYSVPANRRRYNDLKTLIIPPVPDNMDVDDGPEPPERGRLHNGTTIDNSPLGEPSSRGGTRALLPFELRMRILDTYSDLVDARMESCRRLSSVLERRERAFR